MNLTEAIDRSRNHDEIVHVEYAGDLYDLLDEIDDLDGEAEHAENGGTVDIWSGDDWRLCVTLTD
jgi:hypothetical protein